MFALHDILIEKYIDVFALTETKIDSSFPNAQFSVENFTIHRNDRNSHGGGIICYVRSDIPHRRRHDIESKVVLNQGTEMLVIEMQIYRQEKWFLNVLYKPPKVKDGPFKRCFTDLCNALIKESPHWLFIGDTNFNMLTKNILSELCDIYSLRNVIPGPTCHKGDIPTALDVMLLAEPLRFKNPLNVMCSLSDFHNLTCVVTKLQRPPIPPRKIYYRSYRKFEERIFINDLDCIPTSVCDVFDDPDDKLWCYTKLVSNVVDSNAPIKCKVVKKPSVPFMNGNLRDAMHKRNMLYNKYKKGLATWRSYKSQRNLTTSIYKKSKSNYFRERCEGGNKNQRFWKTIKPFMSNRGGLRNSKIILKNGHSIVSDD